MTGSGGGGAGSPGAAAGAGGGAPRPRAARDSCAELVRGEGRLGGAAGARSALESARAGAAGQERAGACMTGPAVPPGPGVQAGGTWGVHPRGVTVLPCDLGVCQCKAEENPRDLALELAFLGRGRDQDQEGLCWCASTLWVEGLGCVWN